MRIVVVSDLHADRDTLGVSRYAEVEHGLYAAAGHAMSTKADVFVCLGDIADPDSGGASTRAMAMVIRTALDLRKANIPSIWIAGNHDVFEDGTGMTTLSPLTAAEDALTPAREEDSMIHVAERPRVISIRGYTFLCLPYTAVSHAYDPAAFAREHSKVDEPIIVLGHLMIKGVVPGEETTEMPRGRDVVFPIEETHGAVLRLQGHYHHRQTTAEGIIIPGSLCRFTFADEKHEPGFLAIELHAS